MRIAAWSCVAAAALTLGCRQRPESPPTRDVALATDRSAAPAPDPAPDSGPNVSEPLPPAVPADPVPDTPDPWLGYAHGAVHAADADLERPLLEGQPVLPGTIVWAEDFSQAEVDLPDGSLVDLDELTELLVQKVRVGGGLRRIELTLLDGTARFVVAPTTEAGSAFHVTTPVGILETAVGEFGLEVDMDSGLTRLVVHAGSVLVRSGPAERTVLGEGSTPGVLELPAVGELRDAVPWPEAMERWTLWDERQADRLLERHALDLAAPRTAAVPALSAELHPLWAATLRVRRNRIETRAAVLAEALGPVGLAADVEPAVRLAQALDAWGPLVGQAREGSALEAQRPGRLERWRVRERTRAERRAAMRPLLARLRAGDASSVAPESTLR
jgi:hypothetical protein